MTDTIAMRPIGFVKGGRSEPVDDAWDSVEARIALNPAQFRPDAAAGIDAFSHVEVIFHFDKAPAEGVNTAAPAIRVATRIGPLSASSPSAAKTGPTASA
jgi:tRNA (Thr-GGU) A37 N-methylase